MKKISKTFKEGTRKLPYYYFLTLELNKPFHSNDVTGMY